MFRLAFALAAVLLLFVYSLVDTTSHTVQGQHRVFAYGALAWLFVGLWMALFIGFALAAWRLLNDRLLAGLVLLGIPLFAFVSLPQFLYERVEISDKMLVHRREPPHTKYNVDIPLDEIASVEETRRESGSFSTFYMVGYDLRTRDGRTYHLPSNTVLTAASETINRVLDERGIERNTRTIDRPK
jgi:hypothetical protein